MKQKLTKGKFILATDGRFGRQYLREKGRMDVGTPHESDYTYWTRDITRAMGFTTMKQARAMGRIIQAENGFRPYVMIREGRCS